MTPFEANLRQAQAALEQCEGERARLADTRDSAIREAHTSGMTVRAIAEVIGLHPSRIGQILSSQLDEEREP